MQLGSKNITEYIFKAFFLNSKNAIQNFENTHSSLKQKHKHTFLKNYLEFIIQSQFIMLKNKE